MKKIYVPLTITLFLFISSSCFSKNPVEGTWELVSAKWITTDTVEYPNSEYDRDWKMIGKTHFLFVRQDTTAKDLSFFGGGTYTFEGNRYTETLEFVSWKFLIGIPITYECKFEDDMWIMTGPVVEEGEKKPDWQLHEEWRKIE